MQVCNLFNFNDRQQGNAFVSLLLFFGMFNVSVVCYSQQNDPGGTGILTIGNEQIEVSVCIRTGGRLVFFGKPGGENILKVNDHIWKRDSLKPEEPSPFDDYKACNGMIVWLSPQNQWWTRQSLNERFLFRVFWQN